MIPRGKSLRFVLPALGVVVAFGLLSAAGARSLLSAEGKSAATDAAAAARVERNYGKLPVSFEPNRGQSDPRVRFLARGNGYGLFLTEDEAVLALRGKGSAATAVRMRALGANPEPEIVGEQRLPGRVNYLRGRDQRGWQTGLPTYAAVRYRGLYPGIDQVFYGTQGRLEYDFVVAPAADPGRIGLTFSGAKALSLGRGGELLLEVAGGTLRQPRPFVYQEWDGKRRPVAARYVLDGERVVFALGRYDRSRPLVIDPKIEYSTYLGGDSDERGTAIAVDGDGSAYVTGYTRSADFPAMPGVVQPAAPEPGAGYEDGYDVFVTKLNRSGSALEYSTYLGGRGADFGEDIAVDGRGRAYVVGSTQSTDFPTTPGAFQPGDPDPAPSYGGSDAFVTKLSSDGTYLKYSTYLGGRGQDDGYGIAVDGDERAYVTGFAGSADFPTTADAVQPRAGGTSDAFVTKLSREGTELKYSTYLGGSESDSARDIAVDSDERAYVTGSTSGDFPTTRGAFRTEPGDGAVFVTKLSSEGTYLKYSTYLGGEYSTGIAVDREQRAYVTGTVYTDWGATPFVTKLSREGTDVKYSTYLARGGEVYSAGIAVDLHGRAYVTGTAYVGRLPTTPDAVQPAPPEPEWDWNAFVAKLNTDGSTKYSTYLGEFGDGYAYGSGIAVDEGENFYVTGLVVSVPPDEEGWYTKFPTTSGAFQTAPGGSSDAFVTKFGD